MPQLPTASETNLINTFESILSGNPLIKGKISCHCYVGLEPMIRSKFVDPLRFELLQIIRSAAVCYISGVSSPVMSRYITCKSSYANGVSDAYIRKEQTVELHIQCGCVGFVYLQSGSVHPIIYTLRTFQLCKMWYSLCVRPLTFTYDLGQQQVLCRQTQWMNIF